jgi:hypothetical protein
MHSRTAPPLNWRQVVSSSTMQFWESTELFKNAVKKAELQSRLEKYPPSVVASPHLFKKVAVPGI